jgi:hypothetical protein
MPKVPTVFFANDRAPSSGMEVDIISSSITSLSLPPVLFMGIVISINMPSLPAVSFRKDTSFLNDVGANHFFLPLVPSQVGNSGFPPLEGARGRAVQN